MGPATGDPGPQRNAQPKPRRRAVPREILRSDRVWDPARVRHPGFTTGQPFVQAVRASGRAMLFISGQVAIDAEGRVVGVGDAGAQARQALENLKALLEAGGATLADVVKLTQYLTDMRHFPAVQEVRAAYWAGTPLPASTTVEVTRLAREELLVEIEAIAVVE